jgi:hypothetical protein
VSPEATEVEARTEKGLYGRLMLAPGDVVPHGRLVLTLKDPAGERRED